MAGKLKQKVFVLNYRDPSYNYNNLGDLQKLLDDGWVVVQMAPMSGAEISTSRSTILLEKVEL